MNKKIWSKESLKKEALKYKTRTEFQNNCSGAYKESAKRGVLDKVCSHMTPLKKPAGYWTEETISKEAKKHTTRLNFHRTATSAYIAANRLGILDKVCSHMKNKIKWDKNSIKEELKKYQTMKDFRMKNSGAYQKALKLMKEEPEVAEIIQKMKNKAS